MLKVEEMEEAVAQQARDQLAIRLRQRLSARTEFLRQRADRLQRQQQQELDEREFRRQQMEVLAERDRIEQLSNERKRQRIVEHNRIVLGLMEDKRRRHAEGLALAMIENRDADGDREELYVNDNYESLTECMDNRLIIFVHTGNESLRRSALKSCRNTLNYWAEAFHVAFCAKAIATN